MTTSDLERRRPRPAAIVAVLAAAALLVSGCGSSSNDGEGAATTTTTDSGSSGEIMNVEEASAQGDGTGVTVKGFLIEDSGTLRISDLIAESFPPQSGGATMEVEGLVIEVFDGISEEGSVRWRDEPATITATVEQGKLVDAAAADD